MGLGSLKWPFVAGSAALIIIWAIIGQTLLWKSDYQTRDFLSLLIGLLCSVVLYAVMRAIAAR